MDQLQENEVKVKLFHKDFIGIYENVLSKERCQEIIDKMEFHMKSVPSEIRNGKDQFNNKDVGRKDYQMFTNDVNIKDYQIFANRVFGGVSKDINKALDICVSLYADEFFILKNIGQIRSDEIKLQKTPPRGGYHVWHCEQSVNNSERVLAWTLYLNDIPDGEGETEFLWQGVRVKPKTGTICIFPAAFTHTHRGNPVHSCDKYIATGWYCFNE